MCSLQYPGRPWRLTNSPGLVKNLITLGDRKCPHIVLCIKMQMTITHILLAAIFVFCSVNLEKKAIIFGIACADKYKYIQICVRICICICICMHACMHTCMYVCLYICISISKQSRHRCPLR